MRPCKFPVVFDSDRLVIEADVQQVSAARRFVRQALVDASDEISGDLQLIVSELVTNAIEHGTGDTVSIGVEEVADGYAIVVTSADGRADIAPKDEWAIAAAASRSGRGLGIVREVADRVDVRRSGSTLTVTAVRHAR